VERSAYGYLSNYTNVNAVPAMVDALESKDAAAIRAATNALKKLMPRLRPKHANLLKPEQMSVLCKTLLRTSDADLAVAILAGLEQVGDQQAGEAVADLAQGKGIAAFSPKVRHAAEDCLSVLADSSIRQRAGRTLLRPSMGTVEAELLRPAAANADTPSEALLRASAAADSELA
jgi:hypothetical protein